MSSSAKHGASISPSATAAAATTTTSSSSIDPVETTSSSSYFLPELIPLVASHLTTLQDFFALRATCRTYRALLPPSPSNLASQAPLLLVPDNASSSEALFHLPLRRILRFRLPRTPPPPSPEPQPPQEHRIRFLRCRVAIGGCDFVASHRELHVYHLLTGERARPPDPPHRYEGVIFFGDLVLTFNYCRIGDNQWQAARCDEGYRLINLISLKGTLYALVSPNERLAVVELDNSSVVQSFLEDKLSAEIAPYPSMFWLAECRSELLLIASQPRVPEYLVFRWQCRDRKWVRTTSLGDCSLFFNILQFAGCLGTDHSAVQSNCVYFIRCRGQCIEYSLVDGSSHELVVDYPGRETKDYAPFAWVLPSIC